MNPQGTSFIPQRPTSGAIKKPGVKKIYILTYISFIVFFGTIVGTAGTFAYKVLEKTKLAEQKQLLTQEKERFDESEMESIRELDAQMRQAQTKLDSHVSLLPIFSALEQSTVESMQLDGFSYERIDAGAPIVRFTGVTGNFNSALFQREVLESNNIFASSLFTEIELASAEETSTPVSQENNEDEKTISFEIAAPIDSDLIPFVAPSLEESMEANSAETSSEMSEEPSPVIVQ